GLPRFRFGRGTPAVLGRPQGRVSGRRSHLARLLLHGRHHPACPAPARARAHARAVGTLRPRRRERFPRRRRQPASADPLRLEQAGRARPRRGVRRRHPQAVRRGGRRAHRRARGRRREARPDAGDVLRDRPQPAAAAQMRLRREGPAQSRQGVPDAAPLRRARPHARARRQRRVSRHSAVLKQRSRRHPMKFGLFGSAQANSKDLGPETGQGFRDWLAYNVEAEALGYRSTFLVEHHFTGWNQVSATLMLLTALAMRTTTLRLGTAVIVLPWHNPVLLAEQAATLDLISGGRLDLGIGKGYRHSEFKGFQIAPEEAEARYEEALEVVTRGWTMRERFSHKGRFWQFDDIVIEPPPAQKPHPPL